MYSLLSILLCLLPISALDIDFASKSSVSSALQKIAAGLLDYYPGDKPGGTPGLMVQPYYWWEAGVAFGQLIDYWFYTGDSQYNDLVQKALLFQVGNNKDYMPSNQTTSEGNDDQGFWGLAVMNAAEKNFSNPKPEEPQWLFLAQQVWTTMQERWETQHCNGGLRWQIYSFNAGYDYKNTVSNGCLFTIGARLARYTGNKTYAEFSEKVWNWMSDQGFITSDFTLYDGASISDNCAKKTMHEWTYNYGLMISGSAYMKSFSNDTKWEERATGLFKRASSLFFRDNIMYEYSCQLSNTCNTDQRSFKGIFSQFLGNTALLMDSLKSDIMNLISTSATAAAKSCSGGTDGHTCGLNWFTGSWDNVNGLGEQICALAVIQNTLIDQKSELPLTNNTGGSSSLEQGAATVDSGSTVNSRIIHTKDKAGAGLVTILFSGLLFGTAFWMLK